jgi:hypothetical protein
MKDFNAGAFWSIIESIGIMHDIWNNEDMPIRQTLSDKEKLFYSNNLLLFENICTDLDLRTSAIATHRLLIAFQTDNVSWAKYDELGQNLRQALMDEMRTIKFYSIELNKQYLIIDKNLFGPEVTIAFPSAIVDIEEAGKCLAFERWTACVFHLMRAMEVGLRAMGNTLKISSTNPNWENILRKCDEELKLHPSKRSIEWQSDDAFFTESSTMLRSVKVAWRNPTMHIEKTYKKEQSQDIWDTTKIFLRFLATKLKE